MGKPLSRCHITPILLVCQDYIPCQIQVPLSGRLLVLVLTPTGVAGGLTGGSPSFGLASLPSLPRLLIGLGLLGSVLGSLLLGSLLAVFPPPGTVCEVGTFLTL